MCRVYTDKAGRYVRICNKSFDQVLSPLFMDARRHQALLSRLEMGDDGIVRNRLRFDGAVPIGPTGHFDPCMAASDVERLEANER